MVPVNKQELFYPTIDKKGKLISYLGFKPHYRNRGNIDDYLTEDWIIQLIKENKIMDKKDAINNKVFIGRQYRPLEISEYRIDSLFELEERIFEKHENIAVFKIDLTDLSGDVSEFDFISLMRLYTQRKRWHPLLKEKILEHAYCIECGDNGKLGLHLFLFIDISNYCNLSSKRDYYRQDRNKIVEWFISLMNEHGITFRLCDFNISECMPNSLIVINKNDIETRNALRNWLLYICKINDMTRGLLMERGGRLFNTSHNRSL